MRKTTIIGVFFTLLLPVITTTKVNADTHPWHYLFTFPQACDAVFKDKLAGCGKLFDKTKPLAKLTSFHRCLQSAKKARDKCEDERLKLMFTLFEIKYPMCEDGGRAEANCPEVGREYVLNEELRCMQFTGCAPFCEGGGRAVAGCPEEDREFVFDEEFRCLEFFRCDVP